MPIIEKQMFRASGACSGAETRRSMHIQNYVGTAFPQKISERIFSEKRYCHLSSDCNIL